MTTLAAPNVASRNRLECFALYVLLQGVPVERVVRFGDPAREILTEAETFGADFIALTTGGRSWLRHTLSRSIAARVFRKSTVPVLLFRQ